MKNFKNILTLMVLGLSATAFSQVAIGKESVASTSASLDFEAGNKGIILPWVISEAAVIGAVNGTMIFDTADYKIKVKKKAAGWTDLTTKATTDIISGITNLTVDTTLQDLLIDQPNAKVTIGATTTSTPGVLVLEDTNKAMILPKMASPHTSIRSPAAGMMAYDTVKQQLAVFNGTVWSFWKAVP